MSDATGVRASSAAAAKRAARAEAQRRRRQNPEVRAAEAEAKRRRRDDPGVRAAEAEAYNRRRREDPAVRAAEAKSKRRRREDPAVRAAEAEAKRRRREDPAVRAAEAKRRHREDPPDREKEPASRCTREILAKPVQTEASWLFNSSVVDVAVETSRSVDVCKSTQTSLVVVKVHRWTETTDLVESQDSDTDVQEYPAPQVCGMPRLTNMDQSAGVATLYSHQVDVCDDTIMDCSSGPAAAQTLYDGSCIVRWCTNTSPGRLFRVPKDNRMEAFLKYAERPHLLGLSKEIVHHYRICSAHFTESDYMDPAKSKLKWLAVPSIKAPEGSNAPQVCGMPRLTNMDQSPGVATLYSHQVDGQSDGSSVDCSSGPAAVQLPYFGSCIVRWCTNTSPERLFRVPKDNRMEAFLKYAERPHLLGLPKEIVHHYRMCSAHFTESDYMDPAKTKLKWLAVPSIKAPDESKGDTASPRHLREPSPQPGPSGL